MSVSFDPKTKTVLADHYSLQIQSDRLFLLLADRDGQTIAELFPFSSVHTSHGQDDTTQVSDWEVQEHEGQVSLQCLTGSSIWDKKRIWFDCFAANIQYGVEVEGKGQLTQVDYFGGFCSASIRWGSGYFESGNSFLEAFTPEPNTREKIIYSPAASERIDLTGVPIPGRDGWFFTPPPFCFCYKTKNGWLSAGVEGQEGQNRFSDYQYHAGDGWFHLSLSFDGYTRVNGKYALPVIGLYFADDPYEALQAHVQTLLAQPYSVPVSLATRPSWWYAPIFCGWGAQCNLAANTGGKSPDLATQENYEHFMGELDKHGINPGTVVIDDKWQLHYGANSVDLKKWPDLGVFIQSQHDIGHKVLLWLKFWDPEGLPVDECITNAQGQIVSVDPTNPKFIQRFRHSIEFLLSDQGAGADGFKVDFSARIPSGPGMHVYENIWGLELMRSMLALLHTTAKKIKGDALIITHTPHPYLAPYLDMIRLNDINMGKDLVTSMIHRQKIARIACPDALIDTDNWPITTKADWLNYLKVQTELGVPALYYSSQIDSTHEMLTPEDYAQLRTQWKKYLDKRSENESNPS